MRVEAFTADTLPRAAVTAPHQGRDEVHEALDTLPVPSTKRSSDTIYQPSIGWADHQAPWRPGVRTGPQ
jgi:hypothetical protein